MNSSDELLRLLESTATIRDDSHPDKSRLTVLEHSCQVATRALNDYVDDELVVVALIHDVGRVLNPAHHAELAAVMAKGRLSPRAVDLLHWHSQYQDEQWRTLRSTGRPLANRTDSWRLGRWDALSFDPEYGTLPLETFVPVVRAAWGA